MTDAAETPLWEELKTLLRLAAEIFGEPAALLEERVLPRAQALVLRGWLDALEAVARALLAALAARLPAPTPARGRTARVKRRPAQPAPPSEALSTDDWPTLERPADSARWAGVVFRLAPRARSSGGRGARAPRRPLHRFLPTRSLAFRFEALIRVAETPAPYARRLARRLAAAPSLAATILRRPRCDPARPPPYDDLVRDAAAVARAALGPPPRDSG